MSDGAPGPATGGSQVGGAEVPASDSDHWSGEARRLKTVALVAGLLLSGLTIIAWTQRWFVITLVPDELDGMTIGVDGDVAAGGLAGLGLAGLALFGAISIAGRVFRVVLAVLEMLLGAVVTLSAVLAVASPVSASSAAVTEATGVAGTAVPGLVESAIVGFWPYAAVVLGVSQVVLGAVIVLTSARWPASSRKYRAVRFENEHGTPPDVAPTGDAVTDWDSLSDGSDPTSR